MNNSKNNIQTVLFDIGGVLTVNPMETVLFTPEYGLVDKLKLDNEQVEREMRVSYKKFAFIQKSSEYDFWKDLEKRLFVKIPMNLVHQIDKEFVVVNPQAKDVLNLIKERGLKVGIISDNTSFWYIKQSAMLGLTEYLSPELIFLSHIYGIGKQNGLFDDVVKKINPKNTAIIEDNMYNIEKAKELGFHTILYSIDDRLNKLAPLLKSAIV